MSEQAKPDAHLRRHDQLQQPGASEQHLNPPGVVKQGMKLWGNHAVVLEHPEWWVDVADDPDDGCARHRGGRPARPTATGADVGGARGGRPGASA